VAPVFIQEPGMSTSLAFKNRFARIAFLAVAAFFFFGPWAWPGFRNHAAGVAVVSGVIYALLFGNPFLARTSKLSGTLLGVAIVGLGGGMNLLQVLKAGADGLLLTVVGISAGLASASVSGAGSASRATPAADRGRHVDLRRQRHRRRHSRAQGQAARRGALGRHCFHPERGRAADLPPARPLLGLDQHVFGTWAALAIHDTSSVVGACYQYGPRRSPSAPPSSWPALVDRARRPFRGMGRRRGEMPADDAKKSRAKVPWFIPGFRWRRLSSPTCPARPTPAGS
jgi:hypothetical protein